MTNKITAWRNSSYLVLVPALVSLLLLWSRYAVPGLSADGVTYLQIARNLLYKGELGWQALWASPLHSVLIAAVSFVSGNSDLLVAASIVTPVMGLLLVIATYKLAESLFDTTTALAAAFVAALSPHLLSISYSTEPEITYTALLMTALALFARALKSNSKAWAAAAGIAFALAYLTRSEGFLIMVFVLLSVAAVQGVHFYRSPVFRLCIVTTAVFFIVAAPYLHFLHKHYGAFVISPKASYVIVWIKRADLHRHDAFNPDIWGLNGKGKLKWQEPRGMGELISYLMADPGRSAATYVRNLSYEIPGRIPNNSGMERYPQLIPVYLALAALAALFLNWGERQREKKALLLAPLLVFFVLPLFTQGWWKYLVPYQPLFILLAAKGATGWTDTLVSAVGRRNRKVAVGVMVSLLVAAVAARYWYALHPPQTAPGPMRADIALRVNDAVVKQSLGTLAAQRFGPGKNYMARWSKIIYYLDGFWTAYPVASDLEVLNYARVHKVDYIVVEYTDPQAMAQLGTKIPGLELVDVLESPNFIYKLAFYRLEM